MSIIVGSSNAIIDEQLEGVNRGKSWVEQGCDMMKMLAALDLNSPSCAELKKMIDGEIEGKD